MRTIVDDKKSISQLKCHMETGQMRLTFLWPEDAEQVYVFKTAGHFDITSGKPGRLFTLQEYKKRSGYVEPRPSGAFTYHIFPFVRENGEDIVFINSSGGNSIEVTGQIPIGFKITEKTGFLKRDKIYIISMLSQQGIAGDVICYVKKTGSYPSGVGDGTMYFFGDGLVAGAVGRWEVKTKKNEFIRIFVRDPGMSGIYLLQPM